MKQRIKSSVSERTNEALNGPLEELSGKCSSDSHSLSEQRMNESTKGSINQRRNKWMNELRLRCATHFVREVFSKRPADWATEGHLFSQLLLLLRPASYLHSRSIFSDPLLVWATTELSQPTSFSRSYCDAFRNLQLGYPCSCCHRTSRCKRYSHNSMFHKQMCTLLDCYYDLIYCFPLQEWPGKCICNSEVCERNVHGINKPSS